MKEELCGAAPSVLYVHASRPEGIIRREKGDQAAVTPNGADILESELLCAQE